MLKKPAATKTVGKYHDCLDQILLFKPVYGNYNSRVLITVFIFETVLIKREVKN